MEDGYDPLCARAYALIDVVKQIDRTKNAEARDILLSFAEKIHTSCRVPRGELIELPGGDNDQ